ncbi:MAG: glycosyltransferase [Chloroflexi bacterium]|nr:glycosyltransferase [Chloroflexota bacterium]
MRRHCILFLESLSTISGGQQVLLDVISGLPDHDLHALLPDTGSLADRLTELGVTCHFVPMARYTLVEKRWTDFLRFPLDQPRLAAHCARLARRIGADWVYANTSRSFIWGALGARLSARPIIWHVHNLLGDSKTLTLLQHVGRWPTVRQIIAVSACAAAQFPLLNDKVSIAPPGIDISRFRPDPSARQAIRAELGLSIDTFVVGIVGDLIPLKGQHTLLKAMQLTEPQLSAVIVGDARPDDAKSYAYAQHLYKIAGERALFTGWRSDLPAVLNSLDILVIASERETGPLVLLEALACGVPVISTPVGRAAELLPPDALFPTGDSDALAGLLNYWQSNRRRLAGVGRLARNLAESHLSQEAFQLQMQRVLSRILEEQ